MRIVIDMQGAQTASRFRGIGRYTLAFAKAVVTQRKNHEIYLVLNGLFAETIEPIRNVFDGMLPQSNILVWYAPGPLSAIDPSNNARHATAELIREAFIAQLNPDLIHISSLFEGYVDDAVVSLGLLDQKTPVSVSFYDLIPYLNPVQYLNPHPRYEVFYRRRLAQLQKATVSLAISDFSMQEALDNLPELNGRVVAVSTAVDAHFQVLKIPQTEAIALRQKFGILKPFLLYTGGADERKNLPRLLQAYARLPRHVRNQHQLLFAGKLSADVVAQLTQHARAVGLHEGELIFSGFVSDEELVRLYNLCQLFIFPSWQEGFGLPALEAMACGAVVIGANASSLPEVIGMDAAMFDPLDADAITAKMLQALQDHDLRSLLRRHGQQQAAKFSWDAVALRALSAWEDLHQCRIPDLPRASQGKPRMAFVSPMPPERTGIADFSAVLLPALSAHYDIELILEQANPMTPWVGMDYPIRDGRWLREHSDEYDRVIYQIGNSPFHAYMLSLMEDVPGTVVLHDFFLSGLMSWLENQEGQEQVWAKSLFVSHGYLAVQQRFKSADTAYEEYPANWTVLQHAQGIVVHSEYSRQLMQNWYGEAVAKDVAVVPLLRQPAIALDRLTARQQLGWSQEDFVVCSFGFMDASKLNHVLLQAWLASDQARSPKSKLVFVGQNEGGDYGAGMLRSIEQSGQHARIVITGFVSSEMYALHLAAADVAVQLRTRSRGETSAAALDCMNYGVPLIVNANGSMAELNGEAVWVLPDEFDRDQLTNALDVLFQQPFKRKIMCEQAQRIIRTRHVPTVCAAQYAASVEKFHRERRMMPSVLMPLLAEILPPGIQEHELFSFSQALARNFPVSASVQTLYLDVTATCSNDLKTGIERVARSLVLAFLQSPPVGYRIEPVYLCEVAGTWLHRKATQYTFGLLGCPADHWSDSVVEPQNGDIVLVLDLSGDRFVKAQQAHLFDQYRQQGATVHAVVYDLLPVKMPEVFPPGADQAHAKWLTSVLSLDGALCISKAVQDDLVLWQEQTGMTWQGRLPFRLGYFHLGADVEQSAPSRGLPEGAGQILSQLRARPSFLMVGTIEPRKNHIQVLEAFTRLWAQGVDVNLVIVGGEGWLGLDSSLRRNIPEVIGRLRDHPERQKRLFWPEDVSDEFLTQIYGACACLIAASWGEGFGLPLIEAAQHRLPILARDIPVFREVAGDTATYFNGKDVSALTRAVKGWLGDQGGHALRSEHKPRLTWQQSAAQVFSLIQGRGHKA